MLHSTKAAFFIFLFYTLAAQAFFPGPVGGHGTMRAGFELGTQTNKSSYADIHYRFGLHDFLDPKTEYPSTTQLDILSLRLRLHTQDTKLWLEDFAFFRIISLPAFGGEGTELSWELEGGIRTSRTLLCNNCNTGYGRGGVGVTFSALNPEDFSFYVLAEGELSVAPYPQSIFQPSLGPLAGVRFSLFSFLMAKVQTRYAFYLLSLPTDGWELEGEVRMSLWDFASLSVRGSRRPDGIDAGFGACFYF